MQASTQPVSGFIQARTWSVFGFIQASGYLAVTITWLQAVNAMCIQQKTISIYQNMYLISYYCNFYDLASMLMVRIVARDQIMMSACSSTASGNFSGTIPWNKRKKKRIVRATRSLFEIQNSLKCFCTTKISGCGMGKKFRVKRMYTAGT